MMDWHLLVVDDQARSLETIVKCLDGRSFRLDLADHVEGAWKMLNAAGAAYDLIMLGSMAPGVKGIELLRRIRAEKRVSGTPVIMLTAAPDEVSEKVREGMQAGAYYYLAAPFEPAALRAIVSAALAEVAPRHQVRQERRRPSAGLQLLLQAEFSFSSLAEVEALTRLLSSLCPEPEKVALGLAELLVNAVEHSNLGIGYQEKSRLRREEEWDGELARRLALPEYRERRATVRVEQRPTEIVFTISDAGDGFLWRDYLETDPRRAFDPNGRGIALARQISFSRIEYPGCGNVVMATVALAQDDSRPSEDVPRS